MCFGEEHTTQFASFFLYVNGSIIKIQKVFEFRINHRNFFIVFQETTNVKTPPK